MPRLDRRELPAGLVRNTTTSLEPFFGHGSGLPAVSVRNHLPLL